MSGNDLQVLPSNRPGHLVPALLAVMLAGCSQGSGDAGAVSQAVLDQAARSVVKAEGLLTPEQLSELIIAGRSPVDVIDLRAPQAFGAGHIKGARNMELTFLVSAEGRAGLGGAGTPVLVSEDGTRAAQAGALLRVAGISAQVLSGGYASWQQAMVEPGTGDAAADSETARAQARRQAVACWFEGDYVAVAGLVPKSSSKEVPPPAGYVPPLQPAAPPQEDPLGLGLGLGLGPSLEPAPAAKAPRKLKVREGC